MERQLLQVIDGLPADRFRHVLVVRGWDATCEAAAGSVGPNVVLVREPSCGRERFWAIELASIVRQYAVDILHVRGLSMLIDSLLAARLCRGVKVAFSFHGFEQSGVRFGALRRRLYRAAVNRCDDCWAVSRSAAEAITTELRVPPSRFGVVANGVDTQRYTPAVERTEIRGRFDLPGDRLVVLAVGNLKPVKGHNILLQAARDLGPDADGAVLVLVGGDYFNGELQSWARRHAADCDIRFVGEQADTLSWYQAADVFVLPSLWEGMSNALLEAMACGLPVIATAVGGNSDVIVHGRTGLLVPPGEPNELSAALRRMMSDESLRAVLAEAGRREVCSNFSAGRAVAEYARRYEALAAQRCRVGESTDGRGGRPYERLEESLERLAP